MVQVPIIAVCEDGHLQDFPWREWAHKSANPECQASLRLTGEGGSSLLDQYVSCGCGRSRKLRGSFGFSGELTNLTKNLCSNGDDGGHGDRTDNLFKCQGIRPWTGSPATSPCEKSLLGSFRNSSNIYYAQVVSSIYIPRAKDNVSEKLRELFENNNFQMWIDMQESQIQRNGGKLSAKILVTPKEGEPNNRKAFRDRLREFPENEIDRMLQLRAVESGGGAGPQLQNEMADGIDKATDFRFQEYEVLTNRLDDEDLKISPKSLDEYASPLGDFFESVMLIDKLRETRVLNGFTRVYPTNDQSLSQRQNMLWRKPISNPAERWLPASVVYGEGLFIKFKEDRLKEWENNANIIDRIKKLNKNAEAAQRSGNPVREISPRFVLLHTFAHTLINQLTFDCGYSTAALAERIYVSQDPAYPMAGILIYTADGDAEGTMGGLVRMGKPGFLEPLILRALTKSQWCSADPICMEIGAGGGQGPDSCNLAACHSCGLIPETACEEFNKFLDRALIVGDASNQIPGYFSQTK